MLRIMLLSGILFFLFIVTHFCIFYIFDPKEKEKRLIYTFSVFLIFGVSIYSLTPLFSSIDVNIDSAFPRLYKFLSTASFSIVFILLFIGYLEFYFTADRSITFRMLILIDESPEKQLSVEETLQKYEVENIIVSRFDDLEYGKYIKKNQNDTYSLTRKGKAVSWVYKTAFSILNFKRSEFTKSN